MLKRLHKIFLGFSLVFSLGSCSIREDRGLCPCWLEFFFDNCTEVADSLVLCGYYESTLFQDELSLKEISQVMEKKVTRGMIRTCAYSGVKNSIVNEYRFVTPEGQQADKLFLHTNTIDCDGEFAYDTVRLHKQWVNVKVKVHIPVEIANKACSLEVRSKVAGLDILNLSPIYGDFRFTPILEDDDTYNFRLLRHDVGNEDLFMDIYLERFLVDKMNLTDVLASQMYDWTAKDLSDVEMDIDIVNKTAFIKVVPWENMGNDNIIF